MVPVVFRRMVTGRRVRHETRPRLEVLESRVLPTVRIVSWNIEADINGVTTPRTGSYQVLEGIGEEKIQGNAQPPDIIGLEETTSNSVTVAPIVSNLNTYYSGLAVYAQSPYQATQNGSNSSGNGPNAIVYNSSTLNLLGSVGVGTPQGASNGEYRQVVRYEFQPTADSGTAGIFYLYVSHMKSGTTSADVTARGEEAAIIRSDETTLPANASVLYTGDLNSAPPEAEFTTFTASGQGQAFDPLNFSTSVQYYSESATNLRFRDDYELMTSNVINDAGAINYVSGTLHTFGNNGSTPAGGSVGSGSNTALNSDLVQDGPTFISASQLYGDLTTASDHLPVVADYGTATVGTTTSLTSSPNPSVFGQPVTLTAMVTGSDAGVPTGTVTFVDGATIVGAGNVNAAGTATCTVSNLPVATNTLTAVYGGDTRYVGSTSSSVSQVVNSASTTTSLADNGPNPSVLGQPVSFLVSVSPAVSDGETVNLEDTSNGNAVVGTGILSGGSATVMVSGLSAGSHALIAAYAGDTSYLPSQSGPVTQVVNSSSAGVFGWLAGTAAATYGAGPITLTVSRYGGDSGAASVQVYSTDGSAVNGTDYSAIPQSNPTTVEFADGQTMATVTLSIADPTTVRGTRSFSVSLVNPTGGSLLGYPTTTTVTISDPPLQVVSATLVGNEAVVTFNRAPNLAMVHLYQSPGAGLGPADLTLVGANTGAVQGSLIQDPTNRTTVTYVTTAGILAADTYTLTLLGVGNGPFVWQTGNGQALNGGANYVNAGLTAAFSGAVVSVPSFARGAGQTVNLPANSTNGIGLTIASGGAGSITANSVSFDLDYDPTLLTIAPNGALSGVSGLNTSVSYTIVATDAHHDVLEATLGGTGLTATAAGVPLVQVAASVPAGAPYASKAVLGLTNVTVNGSAANGVAGVDVAAYAGDVHADGSYTPLDAALIDSVSGGGGTGFSVFQNLAPAIVGDVSGSGNGNVAPLDATEVNLKGTGGTIAAVPNIPSGQVAILAATWVSAVATITAATAPPLGFAAGQTVVVAGVTGATGYNGTFTILSVPTATSFTYALSTQPTGSPGFAGATATASPGHAGPDPTLFLQSTSGSAGLSVTVHVLLNVSDGMPIASIAESGTTVTVTLKDSSQRNMLSPGERVVISGVDIPGYNGTATVTSVQGNTFLFTSPSTDLAVASEGSAAPYIDLAALSEAIGFDPTLLTVTKVVTGANDVLPITALSEAGTTVTATTSTRLPSLMVGGLLTISGVSSAGYDGLVTVTSVSGNTFTWTAASGLGSATLSNAAATIPGLDDIGSFTTTAGTVDNNDGLLRVGQFYSGSPVTGSAVPAVAGGSLIDVLDFVATVNPKATPGTATVLNLLATGTSNGSTTSTSIASINGTLPLGPTPTNRGGDAVDATLTVVPNPGPLAGPAPSNGHNSPANIEIENSNKASLSREAMELSGSHIKEAATINANIGGRSIPADRGWWLVCRQLIALEDKVRDVKTTVFPASIFDNTSVAIGVDSASIVSSPADLSSGPQVRPVREARHLNSNLGKEGELGNAIFTIFSAEVMPGSAGSPINRHRTNQNFI
jgi:hypothetical protein